MKPVKKNRQNADGDDGLKEREPALVRLAGRFHRLEFCAGVMDWNVPEIREGLRTPRFCQFADHETSESPVDRQR